MLNTAKMQAKAFSNSITHEVSSSWGGIGKSMAGWFAGMASFEGLKRGVEWFAETGKEIKETAEQVEMSTDSWQKWTAAVGKAGLSVSGFQRIVETLRQKRTDALSDPKARGELTRLGFSDEDITGDMDMIGKRGLKYSTATKYVDGAEPMFQKEDLKQAEELSMEFRKLSKASGMATLGLIRFFTGNQEYQRKTMGFWSAVLQKGLGMRGILWDKDFTVSGHALQSAEQGRREGYFDAEYQPVKATRTPEMARRDKAAAKKVAPASSTSTGTGNPQDPMDAKLAVARVSMQKCRSC